MSATVIKNASIVNEGIVQMADVLIRNERIEKIAPRIASPGAVEINADGLYLFPGMIDDQVHFREPGYTYKGTIYKESKAAVAGGITSFMDMPNTYPNTTTLERLEAKYALAAKYSLANYSFFMGITKDNLEEALCIDNTLVCGLSDDGLYFDSHDSMMANHPDFLEQLFSRSDALIALHCEDEDIIRKNTDYYKEQFGDDIPVQLHPQIRTAEACLIATARVMQIAKACQNRVHILHVSTAQEAALFSGSTPLRTKRITAEACIHHLWFSDAEYDLLGNAIKWNPAIKRKEDATGLMAALHSGQLDNIATDHAPHLWTEKTGNYFESKAGGPLLQHALPLLLELYHNGSISLEQIASLTSHHVADIYRILDRGYIREGYYADLVLVDLGRSWTASESNTLYTCGWSPFTGQVFRSMITHTFVNGHCAYSNGRFYEHHTGKRLLFEKDRL